MVKEKLFIERCKLFNIQGEESHVVPHFEKYQSDFVEKEIMPLTYDKIIYGLNDNAVIAHSDSGIVFDGDVFELKSGVIRQIS